MPSPAFRIGDCVYVKAQFFHTAQPSRKLVEKNLGLFEIIGTPGMHSITVHLPQQFRGVHPIFHISQLEPTFQNPFPHREQPPPPIELDGEMEYEVSEILDSKLDHCFKAGDALCYLVHWMGYEGTDEETSWVAASDLANALDLCTSQPNFVLLLQWPSDVSDELFGFPTAKVCTHHIDLSNWMILSLPFSLLLHLHMPQKGIVMFMWELAKPSWRGVIVAPVIVIIRCISTELRIGD